jgi:ubiquinone biosynthesis protein Coq4
VISDRLTLRQGLEQYYRDHPDFVQNQDLLVGWVRVSWRDLQKHDMMHVVTGYGTSLPEEVRLDGIFLTALTWRRPWYYYPRSLALFLAVLGSSLKGEAGSASCTPVSIIRFYLAGLYEGWRYRKKIDGYIDPETILERSLGSLRQEYGIEAKSALADDY